MATIQNKSTYIVQITKFLTFFVLAYASFIISIILFDTPCLINQSCRLPHEIIEGLALISVLIAPIGFIIAFILYIIFLLSIMKMHPMGKWVYILIAGIFAGPLTFFTLDIHAAIWRIVSNPLDVIIHFI